MSPLAIIFARILAVLMACYGCFYTVLSAPTFVPPMEIGFVFEMIGYGVMMLGFVVATLVPDRGSLVALGGLALVTILELLRHGQLPLGNAWFVFAAGAALIALAAFGAPRRPQGLGKGDGGHQGTHQPAH
jgi:hypothetical protein